jgi:hypothetical protein
MSQVPVSEHPLRGLDMPRMGDGRCKENRAMPRLGNFPVRSVAWSSDRECLP